MSDIISKPMQESYTDKYFFYYGTDTIEDMNENIDALGLNRGKCYFIKLNNQFYAVFFQSFEKQIIIGRDKVFFSKNGRLIESTVSDAKIDFKVDSRNVKFYTDTLAVELNHLYDPITIYEYPTIKSVNYREVKKDIRLSNYVVILGVTFASRFYTIFEAEKMAKYFVHTPELISFLKRTKGAVSIDPFSQLIKFEDGRISPYSYRRVLESNYYSYRSNDYYKNDAIGYKTIFALQEKNLYSPFRTREWPSITLYQALYPNDNIFYSAPDYRGEENSCKWCGNTLPEGKKSYCSIDCRLEFGRAVNVERGALLPYLIMCRDKFTCQVCGKDMALVNKYGMKVPISRLHETADSDGVYRSEAEVDHLKALKDGGTDHQSNLQTKCQECHKEKHRAERKLLKDK